VRERNSLEVRQRRYCLTLSCLSPSCDSDDCGSECDRRSDKGFPSSSCRTDDTDTGPETNGNSLKVSRPFSLLLFRVGVVLSTFSTLLRSGHGRVVTVWPIAKASCSTKTEGVTRTASFDYSISPASSMVDFRTSMSRLQFHFSTIWSGSPSPRFLYLPSVPERRWFPKTRPPRLSSDGAEVGAKKVTQPIIVEEKKFQERISWFSSLSRGGQLKLSVDFGSSGMWYILATLLGGEPCSLPNIRSWFSLVMLGRGPLVISRRQQCHLPEWATWPSSNWYGEGTESQITPRGGRVGVEDAPYRPSLGDK